MNESKNSNISSSAKAEIERLEQKRLKRIEEREPTKLDVFVDNMKQSKYLLVRWFYHVGFAVWTLFMMILSFFIWLIALTPG